MTKIFFQRLVVIDKNLSDFLRIHHKLTGVANYVSPSTIIGWSYPFSFATDS